MFTSVYLCARARVRVYVCVCLCVLIFVCVCVYVCVCVCVCVGGGGVSRMGCSLLKPSGSCSSVFANNLAFRNTKTAVTTNSNKSNNNDSSNTSKPESIKASVEAASDGCFFSLFFFHVC